MGGCSREPSCHVNDIGIDGKMNQSALLKVEYFLAWIAIVSVLLDRVVDSLACHWVL
jgi:hypothetical protein